MQNLLPGGSGDCALSGFYLSTFPPGVTLPGALLPPAKLSRSRKHTSLPTTTRWQSHYWLKFLVFFFQMYEWFSWSKFFTVCKRQSWKVTPKCYWHLPVRRQHMPEQVLPRLLNLWNSVSDTLNSVEALYSFKSQLFSSLQSFRCRRHPIIQNCLPQMPPHLSSAGVLLIVYFLI